MISNQLPQLKKPKIKSFLLKIPLEMFIILLLYSDTFKLIAGTSPPMAGRTGTTPDTNYIAKVISVASTQPVLANNTGIQVTNVSFDLSYSKNLSNVYIAAQRKILNDLNNLLINFTADTVDATSIQITINMPELKTDLESRHDNDKSYRLMYNISYRLRTAELLLLKISDHCFKVPMKDYDDINTCTSKIYYFGHYNDTSNKDYDYLLDHCKPQFLTRPVNRTSSSTVVVINNLLPSRYYEFKVSPYLVQHEKVPNFIPMAYNSTNYIHNCTKEGIPLYSPQTDLGSFELMLPTKSEEDRVGLRRRMRRVKLYWRPVPILFEGHKITTHIRCHNHDKKEVLYENTFDRETREFYSFELSKVREVLQNCTYTCIIQSKNSHGYSPDSSIIQVPEQQQIIDTRGVFKIYAAAVGGGDYLVRWTDVQEIAPELIKSNQNNQNGTYTVYWCKQENCESGIEAMKKFPARLNNYNLHTPELIQIPGEVTAIASENRRFGISYRSWKSKNYTGIHWSSCVGRIVHAHEPFEKLATHNISSYWISFNWDVRGGCLALLTFFDEFHINYCELGSIDPCLAPGTTEGIAGSLIYENNSNCYDYTVKNNLTTDATITNLKPATKYVVRIRAVVHKSTDGRNLWSDNLVFRTHPESQHQCKKFSPTIIVVLFIVVILGCWIFVYCQESVRHYKSILKLYKRTNVKLPQRFEDPWYKNDEPNEVGLTYWLSRDSQGAEPQVESSMDVHNDNNENNQILGAIVDNFFSDEDNQSDPVDRTSSSVPDYVDPSVLLTSQPTQSNQDNTQDNLTESLSRERDTISDIDEISITSHSSFLENLLNDES